MTILSTGPRVNGFRRASDAVSQPPSSVKSFSTFANTFSVSTRTHAKSRPGPSDLLSRFLEQFHDLESYKYIDLPLVPCRV
jgi:hypothetical protein